MSSLTNKCILIFSLLICYVCVTLVSGGDRYNGGKRYNAYYTTSTRVSTDGGSSSSGPEFLTCREWILRYEFIDDETKFWSGAEKDADNKINLQKAKSILNVGLAPTCHIWVLGYIQILVNKMLMSPSEYCAVFNQNDSTKWEDIRPSYTKLNCVKWIEASGYDINIGLLHFDHAYKLITQGINIYLPNCGWRYTEHLINLNSYATPLDFCTYIGNNLEKLVSFSSCVDE